MKYIFFITIGALLLVYYLHYNTPEYFRPGMRRPFWGTNRLLRRVSTTLSSRYNRSSLKVRPSQVWDMYNRMRYAP